VAAVVVLIVFFSSWHGPFQPAVSLADFRGEMLSFVKLPPPMELESSNLEHIQNWLAKAAAPTDVFIPPGLATLDPIGCRVLFFRGQRVTLICFRRSGKNLAHLLVVDRGVLPKLRTIRNPIFAPDGSWMTASWQRDNRIYLLATQGDRALLEHYIHGR
jgi:hypothetical protein